MTRQGPAIDRLPKGPHGLSREQVQASQRERVLAAVLDAVGEHGYAEATVAHVTKAAHVSRSAFYEQFTDKRDAFLAACESFGQRLFDELVEVAAASPTPLAAVGACSDLLVDWGRRHLLASRAVLLEIYAAGEAGLECRDRIMRRGEAVFEQAAAWTRQLDPALPPPRPFIARVVIAASFELSAQALRNPTREAFAAAKDAIAHTWLLGLTGQERIRAKNGR